MVVDAVRTYLDAANGLTELSRKQAVAAAKTLLRANGAGGPALPAGDADNPPPRVGQNIQALAGELIETSQSNRSAIAELVRAEVERQLERMDVVPRGEHERLVRRVAELERRLAARHTAERAPAPEPDAVSSPVSPAATEPAGQDGEAAGGAEHRPDTPRNTGKGAGGEAAQVRTVPGEVADTGEPSDTGAVAQDGAEDSSGDDSADGDAAPEAVRSAAKSRPRTPAKTARPRSTAKRTPKGKGAAKK
ncbi:membrane fusogenic activity family protein [Nocardiopsis sp. CT-R113]|uniref:Membrane fusogenic activity family protein n=1 Tax=Nocardiopsis codii TaxID=3065942 RepID=A0ABU7KHK6_9ACTN|nr:membrane fusogenic activity family protein [Nocardiopsis sp. CT-R113]MEE2041482.1 membrane fusogenic activity family protein [Nocardiopsis sp. CT-R113]